MNSLHKEVVRIIENCRREKGETPASMLVLYRYLHGEVVKEAEKVGILQAMYKK